MEKIIKIKEALELARSLIDMAETEEWNEIDNAIKICTDGINKNDLLPDVSESTLDIPDIRNKLSPITHLITIIEDERFDKEKWLPKALDGAKRSVNYLAQRDVYSR